MSETAKTLLSVWIFMSAWALFVRGSIGGQWERAMNNSAIMGCALLAAWIALKPNKENP